MRKLLIQDGLASDIMSVIIFLFSFTLKQRKSDAGDGEDKVEAVEITVYDYFTKVRKITLLESANLPCVNVGKPKRPTYYPMEVFRLRFIKCIYLVFIWIYIKLCILFRCVHLCRYNGIRRRCQHSSGLHWLKNPDRNPERGWILYME